MPQTPKTPSGMLREAMERWRRRNALPLSNKSVVEVQFALAAALEKRLVETPDTYAAIRLAVRDATAVAMRLARRDAAERRKRRRLAQTQEEAR